MVKFPVSEAELAKHYDEVMPEVDRLSLERRPEIWNAKYIEMNIAHPFREGNGRALRLWLDAILERETGTRIDWRKISRDDYLSAMQRSPINSLELATLLQLSTLNADALGDRDIFLAVLSASYKYEM